MSWAEQWREAVAGISGWRRRTLAVVVGALTALAFAPFYAVPVLLVSFTALVWLLDGVTLPVGGQTLSRLRLATRAFGIGWWFGLGHFLAGLYWISFSFLVDAQAFAWMMPFAVFGIAAGMAVYAGLATMVAWLANVTPVAKIIWLTVAWVGFEWVRGWALTGFPWNLTGTAWAFAPPMMQPAAFIGVHGIGLLTVLAAASPAVLGYATMTSGARWRFVLLSLGALGMTGIAGVFRLDGAVDKDVPYVRLRLVQPNVAQKDKWVPGLQASHIENLVRLSREPAAGAPPSHILWPETATPLFLSTEPAALAAVGSIVPAGGALITGAPRVTRTDGKLLGLWNSVHAINEQGLIIDTYDKSRLVPFGEYVPFRSVLGMSKITAGRHDFFPGAGPSLLSVPGAPTVSLLVCYEAIFPARTGGLPENRPGWLLNLTNDAWFGVSSGPYQHLASARFRAVEQGIPLIRVANTGISAVVDPYGRLRAATKLNERTIVDSALPSATLAPTIYARAGDSIALAFGIILISIVSVGRLNVRLA